MVHQVSAWRSASNRAIAIWFHAQFDDFEGDAAADGLLLLGHVNNAAAAFADFLPQSETAQCGRRAFRSTAWRRRGFTGGAAAGSSRKPPAFVRLKKGFNLLAQLGVMATGFGDIGGPFSRVCLLQGIGEDFLNEFVAVCLHLRSAIPNALKVNQRI